MAQEKVMAQEKESCSIIIISTDMEWVNAFEKGVNRFYSLTKRETDTLSTLDAMLVEARPDMVILSPQPDLPDITEVRSSLQRIKPVVPLMVVEQRPEGLDKWIKQGAEYAFSRRDLLTAVKHVQQIMNSIRRRDSKNDEKLNYDALEKRYQRIYQDLPDPVCYVQDGLFIDANQSFIRVFDVGSRTLLEESTLMNYIPRKSERQFKDLLKRAATKDLLPFEKFELQTGKGTQLEMNVQISPISIDGEKALQIYFRSTEGGGGTSGVDKTTGLGDATVLDASLKQTQKTADDKAVLGYWCLFYLDNYRETWQRDSYAAAEKLIAASVDLMNRLLPSNTEIVRFNDDIILFWLKGEKEENIRRANQLLKRLDETVPEDIGRLIHPRAYIGMQEITKEMDFNELLTNSFRAARQLSSAQSSDRIAEPMSGDLSRKDERRIGELQAILDNRALRVRYQPISSLDADGVTRYAEKMSYVPPSDDFPDIEFEMLMQSAERFGFAKQYDRVKINIMFQDVLSYGGDQGALQLFVNVSADSLSDATFPEWVDTQLRQVGIDAKQMVFELTIDVVNSAFSGVVKLINLLRPQGSRFALSRVGRYDDAIAELFERIRPEIVKLDIHEIDTYEEEEEVKFMGIMKKYAEEHKALIIADQMDSPSQLSHVWPYEINLLQGDGIVPAMEKFNFDFSEPLF